MARFAADFSDSDSSDDEQKTSDVEMPPKAPNATSKPLKPTEADGEESEDSDVESDASSSSSMKEDELMSSPPRKPSRAKDKNALIEDENGEVQYAHEVDHRRVSAASSSSRSPPTITRYNPRGDASIIPWAQHVGVDPQTMHVMQASLFRVPEEAAALKAMRDEQPSSNIRLGVNSRHQLSRKHSRDSDGDGLRLDSRERGSFEQDIEAPVFRPTRKYARVSIASSIANGNEGSYVDAGLAMGRSFRVGWGPGGQLVHLGSICSPNSSSFTPANSSILTLTKTPPSLSKSQHENSAPSHLAPPALAAKLLQHHLSHTSISPDESGIPYASPTSPTSVASTSTRSRTHAPAKSSDPLNFSSFMSLFPSNETSSPAPIFRLGSALFDPIDLHLGRSNQNSSITGTTITPDIRNRVNSLRRKSALSKWLEDVVKPSVDGDLRMQSNGSSATYTAADAAFTYLTGHQISAACSAAADGGYIKLSTLISQAGGDELFKEDILSQLEIWKADKLAPGSNNSLPNARNGLVGRDVWRLYCLLGGQIYQEDADNRTGADICSGLDWRRIFGLYLWYGTRVDSSIADVVKVYETMLLHNSRGPSNDIARPVPKWVAAQSGQSRAPSILGLFSSYTSSQDSYAEDPLYALIKLYADPALSLSKALNPLSFAPSGLDWGVAMCWHLYIVLSRVMRVRDFADRTEPTVRASKRNSENGVIDDDDVVNSRPEGHSPTANLLTSSYAFELESYGMIQEAAFVLMHLEDSSGREKAIKDLLARSGAKLDDWMTRGLVGSLKLPTPWVDEAKAMHEYDSGHFFSAYELYISAGLFNAAHTLALYELAPDAVIRKDLELLRNLFSRFDADGRRDKIDGWFVKGKIFLDYVEIMTKLPKLLDDVAEDNDERPSIPDVTQESQIEDFTKRAPKIIALLPDILHRSRATDVRHTAALEEMSKDLLQLVERARPLLLTRIKESTLNVFDGPTKIKLARGIGYARFLNSIEA
ncbi:hypothetical protein CPC08DRAFT_627248 [Agrocybe pediades]|nr:hypothetical protein CPC08DRAFT_627248 [Agrocybe pediades]